jgi:hypothetical protein
LVGEEVTGALVTGCLVGLAVTGLFEGALEGDADGFEVTGYFDG